MNIPNSNEYIEFFNTIKSEIQSAKISASKSVNKYQIKVYWSIGKMISTKQKEKGWGKAIVNNLSIDLNKEFSNATSFSPDNLWRMRQLYQEYTRKEVMGQLVPELESMLVPVEGVDSIVDLLSLIPWGQNIVIMQKIKDFKERLFYIIQTSRFGWSRNVLLNQIKAKAFERYHIEEKANNFENTLEVFQAEQASKMMRSSYNLEFLDINKPVLERKLEQELIRKTQDFIMELGYGFCFIGNQYRVVLGIKEYFIDLLFYHRYLKCFVAIELKTGSFKPEYSGKMDFYLNLLNEYEKDKNDNPAIGIILCAEKDNLEVEFSLKTKSNPIGVAEYKLYDKLPKNLKGKLPDKKELMNFKKNIS